MADKPFGFELPHLLVIAWLVVLYTLLTPLLIFSVHRYRQRLHHPFIYCRRPKLVITCCILTILYSSIYSPTLLILTQFSNTWKAYNNLTLETHFLFNALPLLLISLHFSIRFYQVYYDLNYNSSMADQIWSQAINTQTNNFYINNREKYGKPRFQYIIFAVFMSILSTIIIGIVLIFGSSTIYIAQILIIFVLILHIIPLIIIFKQLTSFLDNIKLRKELLWNVILSFIGIIVITVHSLLYIFMDEKHQNVVQMYGYTIISVITSIIYFCICYIQTLFIILQPEAQIDFAYATHKYSVTSNSTPHSGYDSGNTSPVTTPEIASAMSAHSKSPRSFHHANGSNASVSAYNTQQHQNGKSSPYSTYRSNIRLNHVFKNDDTFKLFIRHLAKEYCIENALFLFESQQFKRQCNNIETQLLMMARQSTSAIESVQVMALENKARISGSKSLSSLNSGTRRLGTYSKQRKHLLLSVPTTVPEQENESKEENEKVSPQTPQSESDEKFDQLLKIEVVSEAKEQQTTTRKLTAHHLANVSNHYDGDNKILDYIPFHLIPQSQIIEKYQNDFEKIFVKLYDKYVDWKSSSFEINISGVHRSLLHSIYVRITYQLLMEERKQLLDNNNTSKLNKPRATQMWQSRKTIVNALKATITKKQMDEGDASNNGANMQNMERKVEVQEVVDALTLAEIDIVKNLNDSLTRFKKTPAFQNWVAENVNSFPATYK